MIYRVRCCFNITDKQECLGNIILLLEVSSKTLEVQFPTKSPNAKIKILTIYKGVTPCRFFLARFDIIFFNGGSS